MSEGNEKKLTKEEIDKMINSNDISELLDEIKKAKKEKST